MNEHGQMDTADILNAQAAEQAAATEERHNYTLKHAPAIAAAIMSRENPPTFIKAAKDAVDCAKAIFDDATGYGDE